MPLLESVILAKSLQQLAYKAARAAGAHGCTTPTTGKIGQCRARGRQAEGTAEPI